MGSVRLTNVWPCFMHADANSNLSLSTGILIAVPIPKEYAASGSMIERAIQQSLIEAKYFSLVLNYFGKIYCALAASILYKTCLSFWL
jgi:pseudouridine-5'-phosphate glycosidase